MPVEVTDLDKGIGVIIRVHGVLKAEEYLRALEEHVSQDTGKFRKYRYSVSDYTGVTEIEDVRTDVVQSVANLCKQAARINPDAVIAVAADRDLLFGLARMWEALSNETGWDIRVFRTFSSAEAWIREMVGQKFGLKDLAMR